MQLFRTQVLILKYPQPAGFEHVLHCKKLSNYNHREMISAYEILHGSRRRRYATNNILRELESFYSLG